MLSLKWTSPEANGVVGAISRSSRESIIRLKLDAFDTVWYTLGPCKTDMTAPTASAQHRTGDTEALPFSQSIVKAHRGLDVLSQDVSKIPGTGEPVFGY